MRRLATWLLVRVTGLPRFAPAVLLAAWMCVVARDAERPVLAALLGCLASLSLVVADRRPVVPILSAFVGLVLADGTAGLTKDDPWLVLIIGGCFCIGRFGGRRHQYVAGFAVLLLLAMNVLDRGPNTSTGDVAFPLVFTAGPWLVGLALQTALRKAEVASARAAEALASSADEVERATAQERLRIARDLHDVVAHNISALSLQAQTLRRRQMAGHEVEVEELRVIEDAAHAAMTDLRQLLGVLRPAPGTTIAGPHEGLHQLPELLATAERVGQQVRLTTTGAQRELPPALSLAAYRILQEALSNARRHAPGQPVDLDLAWDTDALRIEARNQVDHRAAVHPGNGTLGITERAALFGGLASCAPDGDRGWVVRALLPLPVLVERVP